MHYTEKREVFVEDFGQLTCGGVSESGTICDTAAAGGGGGGAAQNTMLMLDTYNYFISASS